MLLVPTPATTVARSPTASLTAARISPSSATVVVGLSPVVPLTTTPSWPWSTRCRAMAAVPVQVDRPVVVERRRHRREQAAERERTSWLSGYRFAKCGMTSAATSRRWSRSWRSSVCRYRRVWPDSAYRPILSTTSETVPPRWFARRPPRSWPMASARRCDLRLVRADAEHQRAGEPHGRRVASDVLAGLPHAVVLRQSLLERDERQVELVGVPGCQGRRPFLAAAADQHGRLLLGRLRQPWGVRRPCSARPRRRSRRCSPRGR